MLALSIAATAAAVGWACVVVGHGGYGRASQWLPPVAAEPGRWPDVVAIVPARNEAEMLPVTLPALLGQDYPGALSVIVVDDASSDGTAEVATSLGRGFARALRVVPGTAPPDAAEPPGGLAPGSGRWAGKVWAMAQGLAAAGRGPGYVLVTDADIRVAAGTPLGARGGPRVRVLLRPALSVPAGERASFAHRGGGGRLHAGAPRRALAGGRGGGDPRRPHPRR